VSPEIAEAIADDADMLAVLHDRELTAETVAALREAGFPACLGLMPATPEAVEAWRAMEAGMASLPADLDALALDELASEYAAIYLTGAYGASPYESVWTDDDHLICQQAMFEWRDIHADVGLATKDWRQRPDDHLVLQLLHIGHAARRAATADSPETWRKLATVLDEHTLRWLPDFAARVAARSESPFYAGLAVISAAWVDSVRDLIAAQLGETRPSREEIEERLHPRREMETVAVPMQFVPGAAGPSW
jgi:TorA maturation chaperone TorD